MDLARGRPLPSSRLSGFASPSTAAKVHSTLLVGPCTLSGSRLHLQGLGSSPHGAGFQSSLSELSEGNMRGSKSDKELEEGSSVARGDDHLHKAVGGYRWVLWQQVFEGLE